MLIPNIFPRSDGGEADVRIAIPFPKVIAAPAP